MDGGLTVSAPSKLELRRGQTGLVEPNPSQNRVACAGP